MAKRKKGEMIDQQMLILIILVFVVGIAVGFFFGKRAVTISEQKQTAPELPKRERPVRIQPLETKKGLAPLPIPLLPTFAQKLHPKIAIVIDDVGYDDHLKDVLWSFPHPVTLAIIPELPYSEFFSKEGKNHGFEIILHQPMEPLRDLKENDPTMIKVGMSEKDILKILDKNLKSVKSAVGINNHMGSRATQDKLVMHVVLTELKKRGMFFMDSLTTPHSICREEASAIGERYLARDVFLDNELESDYIHGQIEQLIQVARKTGVAIGIGHYKYNTLSVLKDELSRLKDQGFEIVALRDLL